MFSALITKAENSVYLPCQKINHNIQKIDINDSSYESNFGYDFTGKGKPRYYDPMYSNYFVDRPIFNRMNTYPAFYLPAVRSRGRK